MVLNPRTPTPTKRRTQIPIVCPGHTRPLAELQFCTIKEDGKESTVLVSACHDKMPMIRDAKTGDWIGTFQGHKGAVWSCCLDQSAYLAATASGDFSVKLWDAVTGKFIHEYPHKHIVKSVAFSPNSLLLATGGHEGRLRVYDLEKGSKCTPREIPQSPDNQKVVITKCVWFNDSIVLVASSDKSIRFWNGSKLCLTLRVEAEVRDVELSKNSFKGMDILTVASGESVYFFHLSQNENQLTGELLYKHKMPINFHDEGGASLHPSGAKFIAGGSDLWVRVFDFESGNELECNKGHHGPVRCLRYAPDGQTYATGSEDGTIRIWRA